MKKNLFYMALGISLGSLSVTANATDLMDVYQQALQSDPVYQAAVSTRLSNREGLSQSVANLLPNLSATANTTGNRVATLNSSANDTRRFNSKGYTVTLTQPLINFSNWMNVRQNSEVAKQADATLGAAAQDLIIRVAQAYFNVLNAEDNLRYTQAEKAANARQLYLAKERFQVGLDAQTSVYNAQASYDAIVAQEISAENTLRDNQEALRQLTGQNYPEIDSLKIELPLLTPQPNNVDQWVMTAEQHNLNLQANTFAMEAARTNIKSNFGGHLPTLSAVGTYQRADGFQQSTGTIDQDSRTIGLQVSVPIFSGGLTSSQVRKAKDDFQTASANRENAYRQAIVTTRQKYNDILAGISKIEADHQAILSAQSSLDSTQESFKVGTRTMIDVLIAQQNLFQAKSNYSTDEYSYLLNTLLLKEAAGTLSPNDLAEINNWLHGPNQRDQNLVGANHTANETVEKHEALATKPKKHKAVHSTHHKKRTVKHNTTEVPS